MMVVLWGGGGGGLIFGIISLLANRWAYIQGEAYNQGDFKVGFYSIQLQ